MAPTEPEKAMKKAKLLFAASFCLLLFAVIAAFYSIDRASYSRGELQTAHSIADFPKIGSYLVGFEGSDIKCLPIRRYRYNEYFITGNTCSESLEQLKINNPKVSLDKTSDDRPPEDIEQVFREIPECHSIAWSSSNWTAAGSLARGGYVILAMDPESGQFWAVARLPRKAFVSPENKAQ